MILRNSTDRRQKDWTSTTCYVVMANSPSQDHSALAIPDTTDPRKVFIGRISTWRLIATMTSHCCCNQLKCARALTISEKRVSA